MLGRVRTFFSGLTLAVSRAQKRERSGRWRASGYSRRGNRSPRLCFKTVLASFPAHGSSIVWCLLRIPLTVFSRLFVMAVSVQQLPVVIGIFPTLCFREDVVNFQQVSCFAV